MITQRWTTVYGNDFDGNGKPVNHWIHRTVSYQSNRELDTSAKFPIRQKPYLINVGDCSSYDRWWYDTSGKPVSYAHDCITGIEGTSWPNIPDGAVVQECINKLYGDTMNLVMAARDLYDANNLALDYFKRISRSVRAIKRGHFREAYKLFMGSRSVPRGVASNWLQFQFGVLPVIHTVQDAYNVASRAQNNGLFRLTSSVEYTNSRGSHVGWSDGYKLIANGSSRSWKRCRCYRYLSKKDIYNHMLRTNPVEAAWDAIPYSFLLDWFIPIGDYLKQFGYLDTYVTSGCNSFCSGQTSEYSLEWVDQNGNVRSKRTRAKYDNFNFRRSVDNSLKYSMSLSDAINKSKLGLSCGKTVTALALLVQRF